MDTFRLAGAIVITVSAGAIALLVPTPALANSRLETTVRLIQVGCACLLAAWPALMLTKSLTAAEGRAVVAAFHSPKRHSVETAVETVG